MWNSEYIMRRFREYQASEVDRTISPGETMNDRWYFDAGLGAVQNVVLGLLSSHLAEVRSVLDLPCGHGRVLRHLVKLFPAARFDACDLDAEGVRFCERTFGARGIVSSAELTEVDLGRAYDLIWIGSLFTHTPEERTFRWLRFLTERLSRHGVLVATFHGRWSESVHTVAPYVNENAWRALVEAYRRTGYGYCDYEAAESHDFLRASYGVSMARPHVLVRGAEAIPGVRLLLYRERGWLDHQDVMVLGRPAFDEAWPNMPRSTE
jgi:SAM-dependent methyltransferase